MWRGRSFILSWPIMFNDLKDLDEEYYNSLKGLKDMGADVEYVGVDFTVTEETLGVKNTVELIPDGANVDVTEENLPEYIEACLKYRMLGRCEKQINELLLGFFDVIPDLFAGITITGHLPVVDHFTKGFDLVVHEFEFFTRHLVIGFALDPFKIRFSRKKFFINPSGTCFECHSFGFRDFW